MSEIAEGDRPTLDSGFFQRLEAIRARYQEAWNATSQGSPPPKLDEFLEDSVEPERSALLHELSQIDGTYRGNQTAATVILDGKSSGAESSAPSPNRPRDLDATRLVSDIDRSGLVATIPDPGNRKPPEENDTLPLSRPYRPLEFASREPSGPAGTARPRIYGYEILGELGRGGMGVVYKARHVLLNRIVALKVVLAGIHAGAHELARFMTEAQAVAHLLHPGIVQIFDVGETDGLPYLSLEFVDGGSLEEEIGGKPQHPQKSAGLVEALARAMHVAHQAGIIHRDLKPANVLLTAEGNPKITDFGLAKRQEADSSQTRTGTIMGTPNYMAPEQASGKIGEIGPRSDLYSLGAILYELLTGRPPFQGTTFVETLEQVRTQEPVPPTRLQPKVPRDLETICLKCLQKESYKRYSGALELAEDLRRFLDGEPILARPVSGVERLRRWCWRNPRVAALAASVLLLLVVVTATSMAFTIRLSEQKRATEVQRDKARTAQGEAVANAKIARSSERDARAAQRKADENAGIAKKNAQLASSQMRLALEALKTLVTGVQNELRDRPGMQGLRKQLVEVATAKLDQVAQTAEGFNLTEQGPARDADVELYLRALAGAQQRMADIFQEAGQTEKALVHYRRAHAIVEKILHDKPGDPVALRNLAAVTNNLGDFHRDQLGNMGAAMELYRRALDLRLEWARLQPDDDGAKQAVSNSYGLVAGVLLRLGDPAAALPHYLESQRWREELSPEYATQVVEVQREWAGTYDKLGEVNFKLGDGEAARQNYEKALEIRRRLVGDDADTISATRNLALSCEHLGDVFLLLQHDPAAARKYYDQARDQLEQLWKQDPANTTMQVALAHAYYKLATAYLKEDQRPSAEGYYRKALERLEATSASSQPGLKREIELMLALARCGRHAEAARMARAAAEAGDQNAETLYQVACGYALCAQGVRQARDDKTSGPEAQELSRRYADLAIELLRRCLALGWKDLVSVQVDPDLDPVRGHPGFAQVIEDLKARRPPAPTPSGPTGSRPRAEPLSPPGEGRG